jgi:hypothetical protein
MKTNTLLVSRVLIEDTLDALDAAIIDKSMPDDIHAIQYESSRRLWEVIRQESQEPDAMRYRFLRDKFAMHSDDDKGEFEKLALLTGKEFDAAIDAAMESQ